MKRPNVVIDTTSVDPVAEYRVVFHVTAPSFDVADEWRKKAVALLDSHRKELALGEDPDGDTGAMCSGHVEGVDE